MAICANCGTTILFGGVRQGGYRFCGKKCQQKGVVFGVAERIPPDIVQEQMESIHQGACPRCGGVGPVDVHTSYVVYSALLVTVFRNNPSLCCRACGIKERIKAVLLCGIFGWWGFPWGILMTPVQIVKNLHGIVFGPDPETPSAELERMVRLIVASEILNGGSASANGAKSSEEAIDREFLARAAS